MHLFTMIWYLTVERILQILTVAVVVVLAAVHLPSQTFFDLFIRISPFYLISTKNELQNVLQYNLLYAHCPHTNDRLTSF